MLKRTLTAVCLFAVLFVLSPGAYACQEGGGSISSQHKLESKFFHKAKMILSHREDLGISEKQVKEIHALKLETKKKLIQHKATIEIIGIDLKIALREDKPSAEKISTLIDQKYAIKAQKAKLLARGIVRLKAQLDEKQLKKLHDLWKDKAGSCYVCSKSGGSYHH